MSISEEVRTNNVTEYVPPSIGKRITRFVRPANVGALYVLLVAIFIFCFTGAPSFAHVSTFQGVVNNNALGLIAAFGVILPLAAGVFDLSQASTMTLASLVAANINSQHHIALGVAILLAMIVSLGCGLLNVIVVVVLKIDSFIGTLATGAIIGALGIMVSGNQAILSERLTTFSIGEIGGVVYPVYYGLALAIIIWYIFEHTSFGRRIYATGFNARAAKLAGVKTANLQAVTLMIGATIAGFSGLVLLGNQGQAIANGSTASGYLLTSFAAVFLGATQFKGGRFNTQGTILAVVLLGVGEAGLVMSNAPTWTSQAFTGVVLILSLAATGFQGKKVSFQKKTQISEEVHMENSEIEIAQ